jgi:hypothetical protein
MAEVIAQLEGQVASQKKELEYARLKIQVLEERLYIDEAGLFVPPNPPRSLFSLVLALIIPTAIEKDLFDEFLRLRGTWPNQNLEIKGSSLDESQATQLISLVLRYDTLVQFIALDANTHPAPVVEVFKNRQADGVTANITREHHPGPIPHLHELGEAVRAMPNQLFLQAFATWELIIRTIREGTLYYVQRQPQELGEIGWVIDRKDRTISIGRLLGCSGRTTKIICPGDRWNQPHTLSLR